jgi:hypothetical protein
MKRFVIFTPHQNYSFEHIKGRLRWAGHVARVGEETGAYRVLVKPAEGDSLEDTVVEIRIILK